MQSPSGEKGRRDGLQEDHEAIRIPGRYSETSGAYTPATSVAYIHRHHLWRIYTGNIQRILRLTSS